MSGVLIAGIASKPVLAATYRALEQVNRKSWNQISRAGRG